MAALVTASKPFAASTTSRWLTEQQHERNAPWGPVPMTPDPTRLHWQVALRIKRVVDLVAGYIAVWLLKAVALIDRERLSDALGWLMRTVGPWLREHRLGR